MISVQRALTLYMYVLLKSDFDVFQQTGEGNDGTDKEGAEDSLEAIPPKSASQASRASKASRKKVSIYYNNQLYWIMRCCAHW